MVGKYIVKVIKAIQRKSIQLHDANVLERFALFRGIFDDPNVPIDAGNMNLNPLFLALLGEPDGYSASSRADIKKSIPSRSVF